MQEAAHVALEPYLTHLVAVHQSRGVFAVEDICAADGFIIIKAGQSLPARIPEFLSRHKLRRPLQYSVQVDSPLTADRIRDDIIRTIPPPQMQTLYGHYALDEELGRGTALFARHPLLLQQLTVLAVQLPETYSQTLIVTWLGIVIAIRMKVARAERAEFVAGALCHLLGMLHISPDVARHAGRLTMADWAEMQRYVERGRAVLERIPNLSPAIVRMVAEHRELPDGTGYPCHLEAGKLALPGQILGVAQSAFSIYTKTLRPAGRSARDLIPIIQINSAVYQRDVCSALIQLLREQNMPDTSIVDDITIDDVVAALLIDATSLATCRPAIQRIVQHLVERHPGPAVVRVARIHAHLESILSSSAVLDAGQIEWMQQVARLRYRQFYRDIDDLGLMLGEIRWQLIRLGRLLGEFADDAEALGSDDREALAQAMDTLSKSGRHRPGA